MTEEPVVQTEEQTPATEKEARLLGWVPKEEFRDGEHWVDAETFVKRGKEINPILRKNNETLLKKLDEANREISEVKKVAKEFEKFQKEQADRRISAMDAELKALKEQKRVAISAADGEAVVAIDDAIDALKTEQQLSKEPLAAKEATSTVPVTLDPIITGWMEKNTWFTTDQKYTRLADSLGVTLNLERPDLRGQAFFDELDIQLEEILPEKYKKQKARTNPVEGVNRDGGTRPVRGNKQTYENLPTEAKEACNRFVKSGLMTKEQYVNDYSWD